MTVNRTTVPSTQKVKKCIIHIGTEKTGTTAIQNFLQSKRLALKEQGVLYPDEMDGSRASQFEFVAAVQSDPWTQDTGRTFNIKNADDQSRFKARLQKKLSREIHESTAVNRLIVSSEHFHSRLNTIPQIQALRSYLENWTNEFEIIVYFRRQDEVAVSFQSTRLKSAVQLSDLSLFGDGRGPLRYYDYHELYQKWATVFGPGTITARLYDPAHWKGGNLVQDFVSTAGLSLKVPDQPVLNQSLSREAFQFLRALNRLFPITPGDSSDTARVQLVKELSESFSGKYYPIARDEAKRFLDQFAESNEALRLAVFPDLPAPLFHEDLSAYPESPDEIAPKYDDAVRIAFTLLSKTPASTERGYISRLRSFISRFNS